MMNPKKTRKWKVLMLFCAIMMLAVSAVTIVATPQTVEAATKNGFVKAGNKTYYYQNGKKATGWERIGQDWYYFSNKGVMWKKAFKTTRGKTYYLDADGKRVYGFQIIKKAKYYFEPSRGVLQKSGFTVINKKKYYISKKTGKIVRGKVFKVGKKTYWAAAGGALKAGWHIVNDTQKYYFTRAGAKANGWYKINGGQYYMNESGVCLLGWQTLGGKRYYFLKSGPNMGKALRGTHKIGTKTYQFAKNYVLEYEIQSDSAPNSSSLVLPTGTKTIKNFLAGAMQPVGGTLYIWAGGHDEGDATRKGLNPKWKTFYNSKSGSYNYANYRYQYGNGLDCSGFVGWAVYQIMETRSGAGWYTTVSGSTGTFYKGKGFGSTRVSGKINQKYVPGDILYNANHVWIVVGQCADKSVVLVHATPPCVQIAGTPTPGGSYNSQAITVAKQYMKKYYPSTVSKFSLGSSVSMSYLNAYSLFRWNAATLSDPDGYKSMTANQILDNLYN